MEWQRLSEILYVAYDKIVTEKKEREKYHLSRSLRFMSHVVENFDGH